MTHRVRRCCSYALLAVLLILASVCAPLTRVNVDYLRGSLRVGSLIPRLSADGRYMAFMALVQPGHMQIFVQDRQTGAITMASATPSGEPGTGNSEQPSISKDGRTLAFWSMAWDLVPGDTPSSHDKVFVRDLRTDTTISVTAGANGPSTGPVLSADGRYVTFASEASNLVDDDTNGTGDVFVYDRQTATFTRITVDSSGAESNGLADPLAISDDGRHVTFISNAPNLVPDDTNDRADVFVHDRKTGSTTRVSVDSSGAQANDHSGGIVADSREVGGSISGDGRYVAFPSLASNLVSGDTNESDDVFVHDRRSGTTTRVSVDSTHTEGNNASYDPSISDDGRYIAFASLASNLVSGDTNHHADVFVRDPRTATTHRVSTDATGAQANDGSLFPSLSGDGRYVAFTSLASTLVPGDTNQVTDLFVRHAVIPSVTGATPDDGSRGTSTTITIAGTGFHKNAVVALGAGVSVRAVTVLDETCIRADITIAADATTGPRNVQVTNVGAFGPASGSTNLCIDCFTVT